MTIGGAAFKGAAAAPAVKKDEKKDAKADAAKKDEKKDAKAEPAKPAASAAKK